MAQSVLLHEPFTGGQFTAGFTVEAGPTSACSWVFAPDAIDEFTFNQDYAGAIPEGGSMDEFFAYIDSDVCTSSSSEIVDSYMVSPAFDASGPGPITLSFDHQFRNFTGSTATVQVYNGTVWTDVAHWTSDVGYPNPVAYEVIDITAATGSSAVAQVRFRFYATWDWWWALDNITVVQGAVGLDELHAQHALKVFPNPTNDNLNVRLDGYDAASVTVVDATGRVVLEQRMMSTIPVSHLRDGLYAIVLRDSHGKRIARAPFMKY